MLRIESLTLANFADYEKLTACGDDGKVCYCSFWHLKVGSMAEYDGMKQTNPLALREIVRTRVASGFHVGALAYEGDELLAWISIGPLPEVYWAWKRVAALGEKRAAGTAGITCMTLAPAARGRGVQRLVAEALLAYGRTKGWSAIEAYPFDDASIAKTPSLAWPGFEKPYRDAGYERIEPHWLSKPDYERWICRVEL